MVILDDVVEGMQWRRGARGTVKSSKVRLVGREIRRWQCSIAITELNWNELSLSCEPDDECCKGKYCKSTRKANNSRAAS